MLNESGSDEPGWDPVVVTIQRAGGIQSQYRLPRKVKPWKFDTHSEWCGPRVHWRARAQPPLLRRDPLLRGRASRGGRHRDRPPAGGGPPLPEQDELVMHTQEDEWAILDYEDEVFESAQWSEWVDKMIRMEDSCPSE